MSLRLGKLPPIADARDFAVQALLREQPKLPHVPKRFGHQRISMTWGMLGNGPDETVAPGFGGAGDCVFAGAAHETMLVNHLIRHTVQFNGAAVIADYSQVTGYVIGNDSTDTGTVVRDAMSFRRQTGIRDANGIRHQVGAYMSFNPKDWDMLKLATYCFEFTGIGFEFPASAWDDWDNRRVWDVHDMDSSTIDGGHYTPIIGFPREDEAAFVTWGKIATMTRQFYERYNDEAWAMVTLDDLRRGHNSRGLELDYLNQLLESLK